MKGINIKMNCKTIAVGPVDWASVFPLNGI